MYLLIVLEDGKFKIKEVANVVSGGSCLPGQLPYFCFPMLVQRERERMDVLEQTSSDLLRIQISS